MPGSRAGERSQRSIAVAIRYNILPFNGIVPVWKAPEIGIGIAIHSVHYIPGHLQGPPFGTDRRLYCHCNL